MSTLAARRGKLGRSGVIAFLASLALAACAGKQDLSRVPASAARAVDSIVGANDGWRLADFSDVSDSGGMNEMRGRVPRFDPYISVAADGSVAATLVRGGDFRVFYLRAHSQGRLAAAEVTTVAWLDSGFVSLRGDTLLVAPYRSDEIFRFVWRGSSRQMELIDSAVIGDVP